MSIDVGGLSHQLRDEETFARRVKVPRGATKVAQIALALSAVAIAHNVASTLRTPNATSSVERFFRVFLSTDGQTDADGVWFTVLVWAPLILLPLSIIALAWAAATHSSVKRTMHRAYVERGGYVAGQIPLGITYQEARNNPVLEVVVLTNPRLQPEGMNQLIGDVRQHLASTMNASQVRKALGKAGVTTGFELSELFPPAPPTVVVVTARPGDVVAVVPGEGKKKPSVLELKPV